MSQNAVSIVRAVGGERTPCQITVRLDITQAAREGGY